VEENNFFNKLKAEKEKFASMDGKQKWSYFLTYYSKATIIGILLFICLIWLLSDMFFNRANVVYSGAVLACQISDEGKQYLTKDFLPVLKENPKRKDMVNLSDELYMEFAEGQEYNGQATDSAMFTLLATGEFNYLIMDESVLEQYLGYDAFYDLSDIIVQCSISKDDCYLGKSGEVLAIKLPEAVKQKCGIIGNSGKDVYLSFVFVKDYEEKDLAFADYILK